MLPANSRFLPSVGMTTAYKAVSRALLLHEGLHHLSRSNQVPPNHDSQHDLNAITEESPSQIPRSGGNCGHRSGDSDHHEDHCAPTRPVAQAGKVPSRPTPILRRSIWPSAVRRALSRTSCLRASVESVPGATNSMIPIATRYAATRKNKACDHRDAGRAFHRNETTAVSKGK